MHIALSRTDNIGDLLFSLPLIALLKKDIPDTKITLIARNYVKDIADASNYIDNFISYDDLIKLNIDEASQYIKNQKIDSILIVKKNDYILKLSKNAKISHIVTHLKNYFWHSLSFRPLRWKVVNVNFGSKKETLHYAEKCLKFLKFYNITYKEERLKLSDSLKLKVKKIPRVIEFLDKKNLI